MPKVVDRTEQRRFIREAAKTVFARRGISGTGLSHVAAEAGMGRSSLYHYYNDKSALVRDVARDLLIEEEKLFAAAAAAEGPASQRLKLLIVTLASSFDGWKRYGRMILQLWASEERRFKPYFARLRRHLAGLISQGQSSGEFIEDLDPQLAAAAVIGLLDGLLIQHYLDPQALDHVDAAAEATAAMVSRMLTRPDSSKPRRRKREDGGRRVKT